MDIRFNPNCHVLSSPLLPVDNFILQDPLTRLIESVKFQSQQPTKEKQVKYVRRLQFEGDFAVQNYCFGKDEPAETHYPLRFMLVINGKPTEALFKLQAGLTENGTAVVRRKKGYFDYDVISRCEKAKLLEPRNTGPRGGRRWYTTDLGKQWLARAQETEQQAV
jgi:hypothetical protein